MRGAVDDYERDSRLGLSLPLGEPDAMVERVVSAVTDFGPLTELLARTDVEEVFVEGGRVSYLDTAGRLRGLTVPTSEEENRRIVDRLLASTDRHLSTKHPLVQARVLQGSARLTAAIAPVADRLSATLRRYTVCDVTLDELVARESLNRPAADFLGLLMQLRSRIVVSGEPGAGKTTLLGALLAAAPAHHCVRSCEEIRELAVPLVHGGYYEVRPAGLDGTGEIALRDLVKFVLAMRPDRIVVGEVRGAEAFELTRAINAGCGFLCTVHANSAAESLDALVNAALMAGENVTEYVVRRVFSRSIDIVVHVERDAFGDGIGRAPGPRDRRGCSVARRWLHLRAALHAGRKRPAAGMDRRAASRARGSGRPHDARGNEVARPARAPGGARMRLLAAMCFAVAAALFAGALIGVPLTLRRWRPHRRAGHESWDDKLRQSGARVTVLQFVAGSAAAGVATIAVLAALTGSPFVGIVPALAVAAIPAAYFGRRRARSLRMVQAAWPDALRDVLASVAAGRSLLQAVHSLGEHGPEPLRDCFGRISARARMTGLSPALEAAKDELADPVSDRVLEVLVARARDRRIDRSGRARRPRDVDHEGSRSRRTGRDRRSRDADQRAGRRRAAVGRARRAHGWAGSVPRLLPVGRRRRDDRGRPRA